MLNPHGYYSLKEVCQLTSLSARSILRLREAGLFPKPAKLSTRRIGWLKSVIHAWIAEQAKLPEDEDDDDDG